MFLRHKKNRLKELINYYILNVRPGVPLSFSLN